MITLKYTSDPTNPHDHVTVELSTDSNSLPDVLEVVQRFLTAVGYGIKELGDVGDSIDTTEHKVSQEKQGSSEPYYYYPICVVCKSEWVGILEPRMVCTMCDRRLYGP